MAVDNSKKNKKLPKFKWLVNDNKTGVYANSFVTSPAMEGKAIYLKAQQEKLASITVDVKLNAVDDTKQIVTGVVLIPDKEVYRKSNDGFEYTASIDKEHILKAVTNFFSNPIQLSNTGLEHQIDLSGENQPRLIESWFVVDSKIDKTVALGMGEQKVGSWVTSYFIPNVELYNIIKENGMGFSIEAHFDLMPVELESQIQEEETQENLKQENKTQNQTQTHMNFNLKNLLKYFSNKTTLASMDLADGKVLEINDNDGTATIDGKPAADGDYKLADGSTVVVKDGKVDSIASGDASAASTQSNQTSQTPAPAQASLSSENNEPTLEVKLAEVTKTNNEFTAKIAELEKKVADFDAMKLSNQALLDEVTKLKEQPAAPSINLAPAATNIDVEKMTIAERIAYNVLQSAKN